MSLRFLTAAAAAFAVAAAVAAHAQPAPLTPSEQALVKDFTAAVNGAPADRAAFLDAHMAARPRMPKAEFPLVLDAMARTSRTSRGLSVQSAAERPGMVRLVVKAANGKVGRVDLVLSADDPGRLNGLRGVATPAPYEGPALAAPVPRADLAAAIDRRVRFSADRDDFSGAVLVVKDGDVIYRGAFGEADKAARRPVTLDTRFNLGSMDKQFTAIAIGQLIEQGKLGLDTRLVDVLPDYPNPEAARKITIRHLLSHSAGLGMLFERRGWQWKLKYRTMGELLPLFAREPLQFEPGARSAYSNEGFVVLGAVVEKVSGRSWYDYVQANIFARAGMTHTGYPTADEALPDRAIGYEFGDEDPLGFGARKPNWENLSWRGNSCGGGFSTVSDMVKFLQALKAGKLLKPQTAALFTGQGGGLENYGFGFQHIDVAPGRSIVGHDGGGPGSGVNSDAKMIWQTGYAYAVLGNYDAPFAQSLGRDIGAMLAAQD